MDFLKQFLKNIGVVAYLLMTVLGCILVFFGPIALGPWLNVHTRIATEWVVAGIAAYYLLLIALIITLIEKKW